MASHSNGSPARDAPEARYANHVDVGCNAFEFLFDFSQVYGDGRDVRVHTRIVMGPQYARELLDVLRRAVEAHEREYGGRESPHD